MLLVLAAMLASVWLWQSSAKEVQHPGVDYSVAYRWIAEGKVESVILKGQVLAAKLKTPQPEGGRSIEQFHAILPREDSALLPLLREKNVQIRVATEEQPFAVQFLLSLAPRRAPARGIRRRPW
jgi:hypothetical protein